MLRLLTLSIAVPACFSISNFVDTSVAQENVWIGGDSNSWHQPSAWSLGSPPTAANDVRFDTVSGQAVEISQNAEARNITFAAGTTEFSAIGTDVSVQGFIAADSEFKLTGGTLTPAGYFIGSPLGTFGKITVDGAGAVLSDNAFLFSGMIVGNFGNGTLEILNGGRVETNNFSQIAVEPSSVGHASVVGTGSIWIMNGVLFAPSRIGRSGTGSLFIGDDATVESDSMILGEDVGSSGAVTVENATFRNNNTITIGSRGTGVIDILQGAVFTSDGGSLGGSPGIFNNDATRPSGAVNVAGSNSSWQNSRDLTVGTLGSGELEVSNGGSVANTVGILGDEAGSTGIATISDAGSIWTSSGRLSVGRFGLGSLFVENGGEAICTDRTRVGIAGDAMGIVTVRDIGSEFSTAFQLGVGAEALGILNILDGGKVTSGSGVLGLFSNSVGIAAIDGNGSLWEVDSSFVVGANTTGTLTIENGGSADAIRDTIVGQNSGSSGELIVTGTNSLLLNDGVLNVGERGSGTVRILNGGSATNSNTVIGNSSGSDGTLIVSGTNSILRSDGDLEVGRTGSGRLDVSNFGVVDVLGDILVSNGSDIDLSASGSIRASRLTNNGVLTISNIDGLLNARVDNQPSGSIFNTGGGVASLSQNVVHNGAEFLTSFGSTTQIQCDYSGTGNFNGLGTVVFEGGVRIGDAAAAINFEGDVILEESSTTHVEIGGINSGDFDAFLIAGDMTVGGTLDVNLINGFQLGASQQFLIADVSGQKNGLFNGLSEGEQVGSFGNELLFISYRGGDGNDIVLSTFVLEPVPIIGDFDGDGDVDCDDLDGYVGNLAMAATGALATLDFDGDGFLSQTDADSVITTLVMTSNGVAGTFPGDLNCDGQVNVLGDAFALVGNLGNAVTSYSQGDINFDGTVSVLGDAFILVANLGLANEP